MMRLAFIFIRYDLVEVMFDGIGCFAFAHIQAVRDAENMRIDRNGMFAKSFVHHDICRFIADTR